MKPLLWWLCLFVAPAVLIAVELFHPAGFTTSPGMYQFLSHADPHVAHSALGYFGPHWWFVLHMIQTPMVGLVAVGLWLMLDGIGAADGGRGGGTAARVTAWLARASIFVFALYFTILDAVGGIGLGRTILVVQQMVAAGKLDPQQLDGIVALQNTLWVDPVIGGVGSFVSETASWAAFASAVLVAAALLQAGRVGWANMVPLVGFGWELQVAHASPHGPIAFALLIVAAAWLWFASRRRGTPIA